MIIFITTLILSMLNPVNEGTGFKDPVNSPQPEKNIIIGELPIGLNP